MEPSQPSPRRRRRAVILTTTAVVVLLLAAGGVLGGGWYYSGQLLEPANAQPGFGDTSAGPAGDAAKPAVLLEESEDTVLPGTWGLVWQGGTARVGPVKGRPCGKVQRPLIDGAAPPAGTKVRMQASVWTTDPRTAHRLDYTDVQIPTELGDAPAWFVPGTSTTWAITVHGRAGARTEALRVMPRLHERGLPVLAVTYRNDGAEGAPASPDGLYHLGGTEWRDVEAAIGYAQGHGATRVLLYGWSMGGAIVGQVLALSPLAAIVAGVVLDAPVTSWTKTLELQAANRGVPTAIVPVAEVVSDWRADIGFDQFDLIANPPRVKPSTLIFHGDADGTVPVQASRDLAAAAERLRWPLRYVEVRGADHTAEWNVDPGAYTRNLDDFLTTVIGTS
ncbi:prolyl oligopeptidase family serine peptidase [Umezawaea sp. Da 62-37]|uniref:alpha/beta hydrolase family protein n=1 Tax=Umezawaea sp. Da 62-37 TaxID=3075927 RepID=UPI0028F744CB|nr:prolyl oligopeptidase family serine peptidase [Umezawaea sp. Da 62-37]WNV82273.1 prolyl oligopeptidase family serine peptidase [Umezawaea sp. Da 62-37]